jgi:DNA polymerase elongation subunit (family B)
MNIKKSLGNCSDCFLSANDSLFPNTNYEKDLTKIDLLIIVSDFSKIDLKQNKILCENDNQEFYKLFNKFKLNKQKYLITSLSLCDNTINEDDEEKIEKIRKCCYPNLEHLIDTCKPKLILAMGYDVCKQLNIVKHENNIFSLRNKIFDYKNFKVFVTLDKHQIQQEKKYIKLLENDLLRVSEIITGKKSEIKKISNTIKKVGNGLQFYNIPHNFYSDEYRLIDVQFLYKSSEILYIFRDVNNKKIYYKHNDDYYFYKSRNKEFDKKILDENEVEAFVTSWRNRNDIELDTTYEADVRLPIKHSIDYGMKNKGDCQAKYLNNWFFDIELDMKGTESFPNIEDAKFPINMISVSYNEKNTIYVLDNKTAEIELRNEKYEYKIYDKEIILIRDFIKDFKNADPDTISGWNTNYFDLPYLFFRLKKLNIDPNSLSKFGLFDIDLKWKRVVLAGVACIDQLEIYRLFEFGKKPSYKLDSIANFELGVKKIELEESISKMYKKDINKLIDYNIRDTDLLVKLEEKIGQINLVHEIRKVCSSTISAIMSTFGQVDPLMISFMKKKKFVVKNAIRTGKERLVGAFVKQPKPGIYEYFVDFDFTSLYPSIIRTYNIGVNTFIFRFVDSKLGYDITYSPETLPEKIAIIVDPNFEAKEIVVNKNDLLKKIKDDKLVWTINGCFYLPHSKQISELSEILDYLMSSRKVYKEKKFEAKTNKDELMTRVYDTRQLVYKVLANSFYGVIANENFRFFNIHSAGAITASGQEAIKNCIIFSHNKIESMLKKSKFVPPKVLSKKEMYSDELDKSRNTDYVITSDTDSIFCCFEDFDDTSIDKIHEYCDIIQNFLNNEVIIDLIKKHNHCCEAEHNFLNMKNELICLKGLFVSKKHYVIRVIEQEGKKIDEVVHVGIDTKRSDVPEKTKEFLNDLINMILKDENFSLKKITNYIKETEIDFIECLKNGDKHLSKFISFTKNLKEYKRTIPQHIVAMLNWNDLIYETFQPGEKGNLFIVNGIDETKAPKNIIDNYHNKFLKNNRKLNVIAIPENENKLPDYFIVNIKEMMRVIFHDRYDILLKPIMQIQKRENTILTF